MESFPVSLALCAGNSPVTGEFPTQRPMTRSFYVFFDLRLSKQSWGWWFETPSRPLWRHCNDLVRPCGRNRVHLITFRVCHGFISNCLQWTMNCFEKVWRIFGVDFPHKRPVIRGAIPWHDVCMDLLNTRNCFCCDGINSSSKILVNMNFAQPLLRRALVVHLFYVFFLSSSVMNYARVV